MSESNAHATRKMLEDCVDSVVMGFHLDDEATELELVCEFHGPIVGAQSFVRFRFLGVRHFHRNPGRYRPLRDIGSTFVARDVQGCWSIQTIRSRYPGPLREVAISLGEAFGGFELRYDDATHDVVHVYGKRRAHDEWDYFEVDTDRPIDFYNPFGCAWAEATRR